MDANLKAQWIEALRSGEYKQTQNELEQDGAFCCLGVLCKVAKIKMTIADTYRKLDGITGNYGPLVELNDTQGKTFPEIADWIEANL